MKLPLSWLNEYVKVDDIPVETLKDKLFSCGFEVEDVTNGAITRKMMMTALMIGMSISVGMAMLRVITGISIWYLLIPGYAIALGLLFFVPKVRQFQGLFQQLVLFLLQRFSIPN